MESEIDRFWFLTWTTYGTWLPGDERGFVSNVPDKSGGSVRHNIPGTPYDADMPRLKKAAEENLIGPPIRLVLAQAEVLLNQFQETAEHRNWSLFAVAIMATHCHVVVGVPGDPKPSKILGSFKSYGSRSLNERWTKPVSDSWWTDSGSKRKLKSNDSVLATIKYVVDQEYPLVIWTAPIPELGLSGGRIV